MRKLLFLLLALGTAAATPVRAAPVSPLALAEAVVPGPAVQLAQYYGYDRRESLRRQQYLRRQEFLRRQELRRERFNRRQAYRRGYARPY